MWVGVVSVYHLRSCGVPERCKSVGQKTVEFLSMRKVVDREGSIKGKKKFAFAFIDVDKEYETYRSEHVCTCLLRQYESSPCLPTLNVVVLLSLFVPFPPP